MFYIEFVIFNLVTVTIHNICTNIVVEIAFSGICVKNLLTDNIAMRALPF